MNAYNVSRAVARCLAAATMTAVFASAAEPTPVAANAAAAVDCRPVRAVRHFPPPPRTLRTTEPRPPVSQCPAPTIVTPCCAAPGPAAADDALASAQRAASSAQEAAVSASVAMAAARTAARAGSAAPTRDEAARAASQALARASTIKWKRGEDEASVESDNPWLLAVGALCIALPVVATVALAVLAARRKKEDKGLPTWLYPVGGLLVLILSAGIFLTVYAGRADPPRVSPAAVDERVARLVEANIDVLRLPGAETTRLREQVADLERRLASLPVTRATAADGAVPAASVLVFGSMAAYLALLVLVYLLLREHRRAGAPPGPATATAEPAPRGETVGKTEDISRRVRHAQLELDRALVDPDLEPRQRQTAARPPEPPEPDLEALTRTLSDVLRTVHPEQPDFAWPARLPDTARRSSPAFDEALRQVLRRLDAALDAVLPSASRPDPFRLEAAMRALRRLLLQVEPPKPRLGPGINRGPTLGPPPPAG